MNPQLISPETKKELEALSLKVFGYKNTWLKALRGGIAEILTVEKVGRRGRTKKTSEQRYYTPETLVEYLRTKVST